MTTHEASPPVHADSLVGAARSIPVLYRLLLRGQLTKGRLFALGGLAALVLLTAVLSRQATGVDGPEEAALFALGEYGIAAFVPLAALLLASPMLGNLVEDRLLVYLWLKPVARWHLAIAAFAAVVTVLVGVTVPPLVIGSFLAGQADLAAPLALAAVLGSVAYGAAYLFVGVRFSFGLWLGLAYLALWENVIARLGDGPARASIRSYLMTNVQRGTRIEVLLADRASWAAIVVPIAIAVVFVALTARALATRDVD